MGGLALGSRGLGMVVLAVFEQERLALALGDYLKVQGMPCDVVPDGRGFAVVLAEDAQAGQAKAVLEAFLANPGDPRFRAASWELGVPRAGVKPLGSGPGLGAYLAGFWKGTGPVTLGVMLLCTGVFAAQQVLPEGTFAALQFPAALSGEAIHGEWWRLWSPVLLHANAMHLLGNLLWWWLLGRLVEQSQSGWQLLAVAATVALASNTGQFLYYGNNFGGLSGVVYGLLGYMWLYPLLNPRIGFRLNPVIVRFMLIMMALGFVGGLDFLVGGPLANVAHLMGLMAGCALGLVFGLLHRSGGEPAGE